MGPSAHEAWFASTNFLLAACQDACNSVGFGDKGRIAHGRGKPHEDSLEVAGCDCGPSNQSKRADIAKEDPSKNNVAELPARRLDHRGVSVKCKDKGHKHGDQDAHARERHSHNGLNVTPLEVFDRDGFTACRIQKRD